MNVKSSEKADRQRPLGKFYGRVLEARPWNGLALSETSYAPDLTIPLHSHSHSLICVVLNGEFTERYGNRQRTCQPSTLTFHPEDEVHSETIHRGGARLFSIGLVSSWLERLSQYGLCLTDSFACQGGAAVTLGQRVYQEFRYPDEFSPLVVEGLVLEMLAVMTRKTKAEPRRPRWLAAAQELLHARCREHLSLAEIAEAVGIHPVHLATTFRQHFACTIGNYQRRLRVDYAREELASTHLSLSEIAFAAGFGDQAHFSRVFKQITGLTPTEYRKTLLKP
jgi:AraC family transcriptional regulator